MTRQDLINQVIEEIKVGNEMGYEEEFIAKNIVALIEGNKEHLDYDNINHEFNWDELDGL